MQHVDINDLCGIVLSMQEHINQKKYATEIQRGNEVYSFISRPVGKAIFVYVSLTLGDAQSCILDTTYKLAGISKDGIFYVYDAPLCGFQRNLNNIDHIPHIVSFQSYADEMVRDIIDTRLRPLYDELPLIPLEGYDLDICKGNARNCFFHDLDIPAVDLYQRGSIQDAILNDAAMQLAETADLYAIKEAEFTASRKTFQKLKSVYETTLAFLSDTDLIKPWERELYYAIKDCDAEVLSVTFSSGTEEATTNIPKALLIEHLKTGYEINSFECIPAHTGDDLIHKLGMRPTLQNIRTIDNRGMALYTTRESISNNPDHSKKNKPMIHR